MRLCVMFVCVGNNVRSAFAEFLFAKMLVEKSDGFRGMPRVLSAGFVPQKLKDQLGKAQISFPAPFYGRPMSEVARSVLLEKGIAVPVEWRSKEINQKMVKDADLTIAMLPEIKEELRHLFPEARNKVFTLREISEWDGYFFIEDYDALPLNDDYWYFVEEDTQFVSKMLFTVEKALVLAFPNIIEKLKTVSTPDKDLYVEEGLTHGSINSLCL